MSKPVRFDQDEVALCPNGHGPMLMVEESLRTMTGRAYFLPLATTPEARAHCLDCGHTMIVADERV